MSGRAPRWISVKTGTKVGTLSAGSTVKLNLNSTPWEWLVVHQGLPSAIYDASCDGTWLLLKNIYEARAWNSTNSNILESSTIQSYLNGNFLQLFDPKVQNAIKRVKIPYRSSGGTGGTDQSGANGLSAKIFLLSGYEVGIGGASYVPADGAKLDYFDQNTGTESKRIAYLNGSKTSWWLRSPHTSNTTSVWYVSTGGDCNVIRTSLSYGIRPAIILPSNFRISADLITYPAA